MTFIQDCLEKEKIRLCWGLFLDSPELLTQWTILDPTILLKLKSSWFSYPVIFFIRSGLGNTVPLLIVIIQNVRKVPGTPQWILYGLRYQLYTYTYYNFLFFMRDGNVSTHFVKEVKEGNFNVCNSNSFLLTYHWKGLLNRKIMSHKICVYNQQHL